MNSNFFVVKRRIVFIITLFCTVLYSSKAYSFMPSNELSYQLVNVPFSGRELTDNDSDIKVSISEYDEKIAQELYSFVESPAPIDENKVLMTCKKALVKNIDLIVTAQKDATIKKYLTHNGMIKALTKDDYLNLILNPREKRIRFVKSKKKMIAEFRSREFDLDNGSMACLYITFYCSANGGKVEKINLSTRRLVRAK